MLEYPMNQTKLSMFLLLILLANSSNSIGVSGFVIENNEVFWAAVSNVILLTIKGLTAGKTNQNPYFISQFYFWTGMRQALLGNSA